MDGLPDFGDQLRDDLIIDPWKGEDAKFHLHQLADDYTFFNHGVLFTHCSDLFVDGSADPLSDWYARMPADVTVLRQPFGRPIFSGIDAPAVEGRGATWNQLLCGVKKEVWQDLFAWLGGVRLVDDKKSLFYSVFSAFCDVPDPGVVDSRGLLARDIPRVSVYVFCLETNRDRWELRSGASPLDCPRMVRTDPRPEFVQHAEAVLAGDVSELARQESPAMQPFLEEYARVQREGPEILGDDDGDPPQISR